MKKFAIIFLLSVSGALFAQASEPPIKNAGFVPANIWYSKDPFFAGETIRIYTIIFNGSTYDLSGTVEFLDNGAPIGKTDFSLSSGGRVRDVWVDWKALEGKHVIMARIVGASASVAGGAKRTIVLENTDTGKSERTIDLDTDADSIGNTDDTDDDNDGVSDVEELRNDTDPLKKDTDGDGISDGKELELVAKKVAEAEKKSASSTEAQGTIMSMVQKAEDYIPAPVKDGATAGANAIERFRVGEGYQLRLAKEEKSREIDAMKARAPETQKQVEGAEKEKGVLETVSSTAEKPFAYVMLASLAMLQYTFEWKIVFYGVTFYVLYRLFKWIVRRVRNR